MNRQVVINVCGCCGECNCCTRDKFPPDRPLLTGLDIHTRGEQMYGHATFTPVVPEQRINKRTLKIATQEGVQEYDVPLTATSFDVPLTPSPGNSGQAVLVDTNAVGLAESNVVTFSLDEPVVPPPSPTPATLTFEVRAGDVPLNNRTFKV